MGQKFIYLLAFILISGLSFSQNFDDLIASGNQKLKDKNYKEAISDFSKAYNLQLNDTAALNGIIKAYTLDEDYKEAQKYIDEALKNYPENAEFILRQGIVYNLKGLHDKAIEEFTKALELNPSSKLYLQILLNKASAEIRLEDYTSALNDYNKALELDPRNVNIYSYRALVYFKLTNYTDAINDYNNALDLEPESSLTYYNRGMTYLRLSDKQKACTDFHKACKMGNMTACKMIITVCGGK
ncbi:MAG: tetratricopeptide repeat protein [Bacteroidales bacterium]